MKKTIALLLAVILCLSLAGTGFAAKEEAPEEETAGEEAPAEEAADEAKEDEAPEEAADEAKEEAPEGDVVELTAENWSEYFVIAPQYEGKVLGLEFEDIQGSITLKPVPKLDDAEEIAITSDNWSQYFEVTEERIEQEDAFGNVEHVEIQYRIDVREVYADYVVPTDSTVAFAVTADAVWDDVSGGYSDSYPVDSTAAYNPAELEMDPWSNTFREISGSEQYASDGTLEYAGHVENITVTRAEGSLYLAGMDQEKIAQAEADAAAAKAEADAAAEAEAAANTPVEVPITLENWAGFFEIGQETEENTNAFGELTNTYTRYFIKVRDEFADHVVAVDGNTVAFAVSADSVSNGYRYPEDTTTVYDPEDAKYGYYNSFASGSESYAEDGSVEYEYYYENFNVTRVEGSLFLKGVDEQTLEAAMHPPKQYTTLTVGSSGDAVVALQQALIDGGFLSGAADGSYGNGTAAGVSAFQQSAGLEATGTADAETQRALFGE